MDDLVAFLRDELGQEYVDHLAKFLKNDLGHEEAADYIQNLGADDDVLAAVVQVRGMLLENNEVALPGTTSEVGCCPENPLVEGPEVENAKKLDEYLNSNLLVTTNTAFLTDPEASERFKSFISGKFGTENFILGGRPSAIGGLVNRQA